MPYFKMSIIVAVEAKDANAAHAKLKNLTDKELKNGTFSVASLSEQVYPIKTPQFDINKLLEYPLDAPFTNGSSGV